MADSVKVLVVESARLRMIIKKVLTRDGKLRQFKIDVLEANDGVEGLEMFKEFQPALVIQELLLSRMSGFELVRAIRELDEGKEVPILVTSAMTQDMTTLNLLHRQFRVHHQPKPFTPWDFALTVQQLLKPARAKTDSGPLKPTGPIKAVASDEVKPETEAKIEIEQAAQKPARKRKPSSRFTKGDLARIGLPSLLLDALEEKLSGTITLKYEKMAKVIFILKGYPVFAQSNLRREALGQMLVRKGKISTEDHARAIALAKSRSVHYGNALQLLKLMDQEEFGQHLLANVREKIESALIWRQGSWLFQEDPAVASRVPRCGIDPVKLVIDGLKKLVVVEEAVQRIAGKENLHFSLLPRFEHYREHFIKTFGSHLVDVIVPDHTLNQMLQAMGSNPWDAIQQVDVLLHANMAVLHETEEELREELEQSGDFTAQMTFRPDESLHD